MMNAIGKYMISIICAAAICGMLLTLVPNKASLGIIRILAGIFLAIAVISPLTKIQIEDFDRYISSIQLEAQDASQEGQTAANLETGELIKQELEAYIVGKADSMNIVLSANITMTEDFPPKPYSVILSGSVSPYGRGVITNYIDSELGIPKERQLWK